MLYTSKRMKSREGLQQTSDILMLHNLKTKNIKLSIIYNSNTAKITMSKLQHLYCMIFGDTIKAMSHGFSQLIIIRKAFFWVNTIDWIVYFSKIALTFSSSSVIKKPTSIQRKS